MEINNLAINRKQIEEGVFFDGPNVVFNDTYGKELLRADSFPSVTRESGSHFSKIENGPLVQRTGDGRTVLYHYDKVKDSWTEELQGNQKSAYQDKLDVSNVELPAGCEYREVPIPLRKKSGTTILQEDCYQLPCCNLKNDGSLESLPDFSWRFETTATYECEDEPYDIYKTFKDNESWVVIHDKHSACRYIYVCRRELDKFEWSQAFAQSTTFVPTECKTKQVCLVDSIWGLIWILLGVTANYGIFWFSADEPLGLLWLAVAFFSLVAFVGLCMFCSLFEYATNERTAFAFTIGPFRFHGDGRIEAASGHTLELSEKVDFSLDGYTITGRSRNTVTISNGGIKSVVIGRLRAGKVRIDPVEYEPSEKELETTYNPKNAFCVMDTSRGLFAKNETSCGLIHRGWNGPARKPAFSEAGVEFHANGRFSFGDELIGSRRSFSQVRFGEVLISSCPCVNADSGCCVRIIHVNSNMAWFFSYELSESYDDWNQWILCCP